MMLIWWDFDEELVTVKLYRWPWKIAVGQYILQDLEKNLGEMSKLSKVNWMHAVF